MIESMICLSCKKELKNKQIKFCSNSCQKEFEWKLRKEQIETNGNFKLDYCSDDTSRRIAKRYLIEKFGHRCMMCGNETWLGKPILLISDHIDGNSDNNSISNIRIICSNCDATLDTYKRKNKNSKRNLRRRINADLAQW